MLLKIKHTYSSSSSDYKLSTGKQLQGLGNKTSYKIVRVVGSSEVIVNKELSQRKAHKG